MIRHELFNVTCLVNSATSSLNDSDEQTSPGPPGSRGVQVANSHFSKIKANNGNNGWLKKTQITIRQQKSSSLLLLLLLLLSVSVQFGSALAMRNQ